MNGEVMSEQVVIESSLMRVAETVGDIAPGIYEHFYADSEETKGLMAHIDDLVRGKMIDELLRLVMVEDLTTEDGYLNFETKTHRDAYSVTEPMYQALFDSLVRVIRDNDNEWSDSVAQAWQDRTQRILANISRRL